MTVPEQDRKARRPKRKRDRALRWFTIIFAVLLLLVTAYALYRWSLRAQVNAKLDAIRAQGLPATFAELDEWHVYAEPGQNAAEIIELALTRLTRGPEVAIKPLPIAGEALLPPRAQPLPEEMRDAITMYIEANRQALGLLHKAAEAGGQYRYSMDHRSGPFMASRRADDLREAVYLLQLEALLAAYSGQPDQAARSLATCFRVAGSLSHEATLQSQFVRIALQHVSVDALEQALNQNSFNERPLVYMAGAVRESEDLMAMWRGLVGDRCNGGMIFRMSAKDFASAFGVSYPQINVNAYRAAGMTEKDFMVYLTFMEDYLKAFESPLPQRLKASDTVTSRVKSLPEYYFFSRGVLPALESVAPIDAKNVGRLRSALAALAVERYRRKRGELPARLGDLVPEYVDSVPADPFDGKPLRYKRPSKGYIIYSIGEDGKDDGGDSESDITFTIER